MDSALKAAQTLGCRQISALRVLQLHDHGMETNASVMHVIVTDDYGLLSSTSTLES